MISQKRMHRDIRFFYGLKFRQPLNGCGKLILSLKNGKIEMNC